MALQKKRIQLKKFDEEALDSFEISPDLYTHLAITNSLEAMPKGLESGKAELGLIGISLSVDQLEQIMRSRDLVKQDSEYFDLVKKKKELLEGEGLEGTMLEARLANYKLGLLMGTLFQTLPKNMEFTL